MSARRPTENWNRAYTEAPEIFDAFSRAEDPGNRIAVRLLKRAALSGRHVLEIGCGTGRYTRVWAARTARYTAVERSPTMLDLAACADTPGGPVEWVCADAACLPFPDASFDVVVAAWVVANLLPRARQEVLDECRRVLRPTGAGIWLLENHWDGEFQVLRGRRHAEERERLARLEGFRIVEVVETELRFPSPAEAERVLGYLCGDAARARLAAAPTDRLSHHVTLLHRPGG